MRPQLAIVALFIVAAGCGHDAPRGPIAPELALCVPAGATALAGVDLDRLRASPLYRKLPVETAAFVEPLREANYLLLAVDSAGITAIARGTFREAPAGATVVAQGIAISGPAASIDGAKERLRTRRAAATSVLDYAATVA